MMKDRLEVVMKALRELRQGKFTDLRIEAEFEMIRAGVAAQNQLDKGSFFDMFREKSDRTQTLVIIASNFFLQATDSILSAVYGTLLVQSLSTVNSFTITVVTAAVSLVVGVIAMITVDRFGRRYVLLEPVDSRE